MILGNPRSSLHLEEGQKHKLVLHAMWNKPRGSHKNKNLLILIILFSFFFFLSFIPKLIDKTRKGPCKDGKKSIPAFLNISFLGRTLRWECNQNPTFTKEKQLSTMLCDLSIKTKNISYNCRNIWFLSKYSFRLHEPWSYIIY